MTNTMTNYAPKKTRTNRYSPNYRILLKNCDPSEMVLYFNPSRSEAPVYLDFKSTAYQTASFRHCVVDCIQHLINETFDQEALDENENVLIEWEYEDIDEEDVVMQKEED